MIRSAFSAFSALVAAATTAAATAASAPLVSCRNELGDPVDRWIALKAPAGTTYLYADPATPTLTVSPYSMNDTANGALTHTTQQLWGVGENLLAYAIYNDEVPGDPNYNYTFGHTKGYFAVANDGSAFYVTHSIPLFPVGPATVGGYQGLGSNAWTYAQDAACFSVTADTMDSIVGLLRYNFPQIYDAISSITYPNIAALIAGDFQTTPVCVNTTVTTAAGTPLTLFGKTAQWNNELYSACVAPALHTALWTETWIRGSAEPAACPVTGYDVTDIAGVDFGTKPPGPWTEYNDHSKWAVGAGAAGTSPIACFGDINRMTTQYSRAGGTTCFEDAELSGQLKKAVTGFQDSC